MNSPVKMEIILDLCGGTGSWSKPYKDAGYDVRVITLPEYDVCEYQPPDNVYGILAAPPCDQFSFAKTTGKARDLKSGLKIMESCLRIIWQCQLKLVSPYAKTTSLKFWALENPNGLMKRFLGHPFYVFNPWEFGDQYKKNTFLWGWFNPPIKTYSNKDEVMTQEQIELHKTNSQKLPKFDRLKTKEIHPEMYGKENRKARRAITPAGFAKAFFKANP